MSEKKKVVIEMTADEATALTLLLTRLTLCYVIESWDGQKTYLNEKEFEIAVNALKKITKAMEEQLGGNKDGEKGHSDTKP